MAKILHVDMDAFYASIEQLDHPEYRRKAVVVGALPGTRGVVSTCSYEARAFGVHSAMPINTALKRCPDAIFLPVRMNRYREASRQIMTILESVTPFLEPLSIDEAFLDITRVQLHQGDSEAIAKEIKARIRTQTGLPCSIGVAPNKFLAKLIGDMGKPDGLKILPDDPEAIVRFLQPLPVSRIWGVGPVAAGKLEKAGLALVGDIQNAPLSVLWTLLGKKSGTHVKELSSGQDSRKVEPNREEKSISSEITFEQDCEDVKRLERVALELAEEVAGHLRKAHRKARTILIKLRFPDFTTITRQTSISEPTDSTRVISDLVLRLINLHVQGRSIRLIGVGVAHLLLVEPGTLEQPLLFDLSAPQGGKTTVRPKRGRLDQAVDTLRKKYGANSIHRASALPPRPPQES